MFLSRFKVAIKRAAAVLQYIRGHLPHNPYLTGDTGPLMRDVKNFICVQLEMSGMLSSH